MTANAGTRNAIYPRDEFSKRDTDCFLEMSKDELFTVSDKKRVHLSQRELAVLGLLARGWTGREIARKLGISESTVRTHNRNIFQKLDASNAAHAVACALILRLLIFRAS